MTLLLIVTVGALLLAAIMSVVAWRVAGDERRRSDARVAALAAEIHEADGSAGWVRSRPDHDPQDLTYDSPFEPAAGSLFLADRRRQSPRPVTALVVGALAVGAVALVIVVPRMLTRTAGVRSARTAIASPLPVELVSLGHERVGDQLTVHGVVRNPSTGMEIDRLTAIVLIVAPDGESVATGRSTVEAAALQPGDETTFAVTVPAASTVTRYRVSFRAGDRLVPHLDRRHEG